MGGEGLSWCGPLGRRRLERALRGAAVERGELGGDGLVVVDFAVAGEG
jgi:hypothetical protein